MDRGYNLTHGETRSRLHIPSLESDEQCGRLLLINRSVS